jgi:polyhydroxybutyrate depolymerase
MKFLHHHAHRAVKPRIRSCIFVVAGLAVAAGSELRAADRCVAIDGRTVCVGGGTARKAPLVVYLHGYGGSGSDDALGLGGISAREGFLYAAPDALPDAAGRREWRAADREFVIRLIDRVVSANRSDPARVYVVGFSLGGFAALDLACAHPESVAAAVSVSGTRFQPTAPCAQGSVSTLHVHGEEDRTVAPGGGLGRRTGLSYVSAREAAALASTAAGCRHPLAPAGLLDFGGRIERATDCRGGARVELWMISGVGHVPSLGTRFTRAIWAFLNRTGN